MTLRSVLASVIACAAVGLCLTSAPAQLASSSIPTDTRRASADNAVESVLAISIDGLNPEALRILGPEGTPHLHAFMASGASTLNARTERELTITLPNHTGMVTGRRVEAGTGGHGVTWNDDRRRPATVQAAAGKRVESVFTAISAAGGSTALFASKTKFSLWKRSWPLAIDKTRIQLDNARLARSVRRDLRDHEPAFDAAAVFPFNDAGGGLVLAWKRGLDGRKGMRTPPRWDRRLKRSMRATGASLRPERRA